MNKSSWMPTRKWWASLAGAIASIAASWIISGAFDDVERGMAATALVSLVAAYFKSNEATVTGDGVPGRRGRSSWSTAHREDGYGVIELLFALIVLIVLIVVLFKVLALL